MKNIIKYINLLYLNDFLKIKLILFTIRVEWTLRSSIWVVFNHFLHIDAIFRSKISSD